MSLHVSRDRLQAIFSHARDLFIRAPHLDAARMVFNSYIASTSELGGDIKKKLITPMADVAHTQEAVSRHLIKVATENGMVDFTLLAPAAAKSAPKRVAGAKALPITPPPPPSSPSPLITASPKAEASTSSSSSSKPKSAALEGLMRAACDVNAIGASMPASDYLALKTPPPPRIPLTLPKFETKQLVLLRATFAENRMIKLTPLELVCIHIDRQLQTLAKGDYQQPLETVRNRFGHTMLMCLMGLDSAAINPSLTSPLFFTPEESSKIIEKIKADIRELAGGTEIFDRLIAKIEIIQTFLKEPFVAHFNCHSICEFSGQYPEFAERSTKPPDVILNNLIAFFRCFANALLPTKRTNPFPWEKEYDLLEILTLQLEELGKRGIDSGDFLQHAKEWKKQIAITLLNLSNIYERQLATIQKSKSLSHSTIFTFNWMRLINRWVDMGLEEFEIGIISSRFPDRTLPPRNCFNRIAINMPILLRTVSDLGLEGYNPPTIAFPLPLTEKQRQRKSEVERQLYDNATACFAPWMRDIPFHLSLSDLYGNQRVAAVRKEIGIKLIFADKLKRLIESKPILTPEALDAFRQAQLAAMKRFICSTEDYEGFYFANSTSVVAFTNYFCALFASHLKVLCVFDLIFQDANRILELHCDPTELFDENESCFSRPLTDCLLLVGLDPIVNAHALWERGIKGIKGAPPQKHPPAVESAEGKAAVESGEGKGPRKMRRRSKRNPPRPMTVTFPIDTRPDMRIHRISELTPLRRSNLRQIKQALTRAGLSLSYSGAHFKITEGDRVISTLPASHGGRSVHSPGVISNIERSIHESKAKKE